MITSLTPAMVAWAMENHTESITYRAKQLQVQRNTLRKALDEATELGFGAFCINTLVPQFKRMVEGKTLEQAYLAYTDSGLPYKTRNAFRQALHRLDIDYIKTGNNHYA